MTIINLTFAPKDKLKVIQEIDSFFNDLDSDFEESKLILGEHQHYIKLGFPDFWDNERETKEFTMRCIRSKTIKEVDYGFRTFIAV